MSRERLEQEDQGRKWLGEVAWAGVRISGMAVRIDSSGALRGEQGLAALVDAVAAASPNDEADWIEWKSAIDLSQKDGQGMIARHI